MGWVTGEGSECAGQDEGGRTGGTGSARSARLRGRDMLPVLRDELLSYKASAKNTGLDHYVFTTSAGGKRDKDNLARRVMGPIVSRADELLAERGEHPLP